MAKSLLLPSNEQIAELAPFDRIELPRILVVSTQAQVASAFAELNQNCVLGFDTESKPIFVRGAVSDGPHVVQFSTPEKAYIFQLRQSECHDAVVALMESSAIAKVGFGLSSDRKEMTRKLGLELRNVVDINSIFKKRGYQKSVGVKGAVAVVLGRRFIKSKRAATSNWANEKLTETQVLYAANDAYAAIQVFNAVNFAE